MAGIGEVLQNLKLSEDETNRFEKAFADPEFKKLFQNYLEEISDPKNREENERYLREIEERGQAEQVYGKGVQLITPEPGFVVQCTERVSKGEDRPCFINICTSSKIDVATSVPDKERKGMVFSIPHSLGAAVEEGKPVTATVHDFVVHPDTLRMALTNGRFLELVVDTAKEQLGKARGMKLEAGYRRFNAKYRGANGATEPGVQMVRDKSSPSSNNENAKPSDLKAATPGALFSDVLPADKLRSAEPPAPSPAVSTTSSSGKATRSAFSFDRKGKGPAQPKPSVEVVERGEVDYQAAWADLGRSLRAPPRLPKELVVRFLLPGLPTSATVGSFDLEVEGREARLEVPGFAKLEQRLPHSVDGSKASAKLLRDLPIPRLEVTAPLRPLTREELERLVGPLEPPGTQLVQEVEGGEAADPPPPASNEHPQDTAASFAEAQTEGQDRQQQQQEEEESEVKRRWRELHAKQDAEKVHSEALRDDDALVAPAPSSRPGAASKEAAAPAPSPTSSAPPKPIPGEFEPSVDFMGAREGFVFKLGEHGLGYYYDRVGRDDHRSGAPAMTVPAASVVPAAATSIGGGLIDELD